jgi:ribosome biogenesis protein Tsr3
MDILGLLQSVAALAATLTNWLHERQLIDLATKAAWGRNLQEVNDALDRARAARSSAELDADLHPERLHDDDGFKRD